MVLPWTKLLQLDHLSTHMNLGVRIYRTALKVKRENVAKCWAFRHYVVRSLQCFCQKLRGKCNLSDSLIINLFLSLFINLMSSCDCLFNNLFSR